tara:strand:+ start:746 stop:877 length:132 start_codon:yes stop_codon:yes gene_type:complete
MKKLFKKRNQTSNCLDEFTFLSPAVTCVNKQYKNKIKLNQAAR